MNINRIRWLAASAFVGLMVCGTICLGQKDPVDDDPVRPRTDVNQPDKPASPSDADPNQPSNQPEKPGIPDKPSADPRFSSDVPNGYLDSFKFLAQPSPTSIHRDGAERGYPDNFKSLAQSSKFPSQSSNRIESADLLLIETKEGLAAYSMSLGKWDRIVVGLPKDGQSRLRKATVSSNYASVLIDDQLLGFSSQSGRWSKLTIPPQFVGKISPRHSMNMLAVEIGDQTFTLSPKKGEWVSSHDSPSVANESQGDVVDLRETRFAQATAELEDLKMKEEELRVQLGPKHPEVIEIQKRIASLEERRLLAAEKKLGLELPESKQLTSKISNLEAQAAELAGQIRAQHKPGHEQKNEPRELQALRNELRAVLDTAFDAKSDLEHFRIRKLQERLGLLEQQIGRRQAMRSQIIDRRARELVEGEETNWNGGLSPGAVQNNSQTLEGGSSVPVARVPATNGGNPSVPAHSARVDAPEAGGLASQFEAANSAKRQISNAAGEPFRDVPIPSYKELATGLSNSLDELEDAKSTYIYTERLAKDKVISKTELEKAKRNLDSAYRRRRIVLDDYKATIHDLELQSNAAKRQFELAVRTNDRLNNLPPGSVSEKAIDESKQQLEQAKSQFDRLIARFDLYQQIGGELTEEPKPDQALARPESHQKAP